MGLNTYSENPSIEITQDVEDTTDVNQEVDVDSEVDDNVTQG